MALADQDVRLRVAGLGARERVTVTASARRTAAAPPWSAEGDFTADAKGGLDLDKQAPRAGRPYAKPDSTGLFGAMLPAEAGPG